MNPSYVHSFYLGNLTFDQKLDYLELMIKQLQSDIQDYITHFAKEERAEKNSENEDVIVVDTDDEPQFN